VIKRQPLFLSLRPQVGGSISEEYDVTSGNEASPGKRWNWKLAALSAFLLLSLAVNVSQVFKIRSMQAPLDRCIAWLRNGTSTEARAIEVGAQAPPLGAHSLSGEAVSIDVARPGKATVLYVFSPSCMWCKRNTENMRALAAAAGHGFDFVPISLAAAGVQEYLSRNGVKCPAYVDPSNASRKAYGFGGTPETLVIGKDGKVLKKWEGAYSPKVASEVASVLGVKLPGLQRD
jgi:peroxiredoxin